LYKVYLNVLSFSFLNASDAAKPKTTLIWNTLMSLWTDLFCKDRRGIVALLYVFFFQFFSCISRHDDDQVVSNRNSICINVYNRQLFNSCHQSFYCYSRDNKAFRKK